MTLEEITGKRLSAFSREHRPAENGGANHVEWARHMDAIDGDLDLVCNWPNCRKPLALIETTTRPNQTVTYRRGVARLLEAHFFHIREVRQDDGSWRYQMLEPADPELLTMDAWVAKYEVPLRVAHGCRPWPLERPKRTAPHVCQTYAECEDDADHHCRVCWRHKDHWWATCLNGCEVA